MTKCIKHQKDLKKCCVPWGECDSPHCEYCGEVKCFEIADNIIVCKRCEMILDKHINISTGTIIRKGLGWTGVGRRK